MANAGGITISTSSTSQTIIFDVTANGAGAATNLLTITSDPTSGDSIFLFVNGEAVSSQTIIPGQTSPVASFKPGGVSLVKAYAGPSGAVAYLQKIID